MKLCGTRIVYCTDLSQILKVKIVSDIDNSPIAMSRVRTLLKLKSDIHPLKPFVPYGDLPMYMFSEN